MVDAEVVDLDDVWVVEPADGSDFAFEALAGFGAGEVLRAYELQGDGATDGALFGGVDRAHRAASEQLSDDEAIGDDRAWGEDGWVHAERVSQLRRDFLGSLRGVGCRQLS